MSLTSSQHHSFDIALASMYGVECAILIHHFQHWIRINQFKGSNLKDGRCWTYQSRKDIQAHFPYWTFEEVKYLTEKLVKLGILVTANYNKSPMDKTLWYAFANEQAFQVDAEFSKNLYERENSPWKGKTPHRKGKIPPPIPDTITTNTIPTDSFNPPNPQGGDAPSGAVCEILAFGKFVIIEKQAHQKLCEEHGFELISSLIDEINDYLASTGKKPYKDYAATIRQWIRRRKQQTPKISPPTPSAPSLATHQQKNWDENKALVDELKVEHPDVASGLNWFYKHYVLKDRNDPGFDVSGLISHADFCRVLGKHLRLRIYEAKFLNGQRG